MKEPKTREIVAPSLEDLAYAHVKNSHFFGLTNLSGKALTFMAMGALALGVGVVGSAGFNAGNIMVGLLQTWPIALAAWGASLGGGLAGWWVGGYDDRVIDEHNDNSYPASSRRQVEAHLQDTFMKAISKADFDPSRKTMPYDALGHAVLLSDEQIEKLPAHIQFDVYRTQMDLDLYRYTNLCSHQIFEAMVYEARVLAKDAPMQEKALIYRENRDAVRKLLDEGALEYTPIVQDGPKKSWGDRLSEFMDAAGESIADSNSFNNNSFDFGSGWGRGRSSNSSGGGSIFGGGASSSSSPTSGSIGGSFGGSRDGFKTGGAIASGGFVIGGGFGSDANGNYASFSGGGSVNRRNDSGGGFKADGIKLDGSAAQGLVIVAGAAAVCAAAIATGFSIHKNFFAKADEPKVDGVRMSYLSNALPSREGEIRQMYGALTI
jgi:hypothetical protein